MRLKALCLVLLIAVVGFYVTLELASPYESFPEELFLLMQRDTTYAPGYSLQAFRRVRVGNTEAQVRALLGDPVSTNSSGQFTWLRYAWSPQSTHFRQRAIKLRDGVVVRIIAELYFD